MNTQEKLDKLIRKMECNHWFKLSAEDRLKLLQEFENIMAEIEKRPPFTVKMIHKTDIYSVYENYFENNTIYLDSHLVTDDVDFVPATAFHKVAYYGRKGWQKYVIEHPELGIVDDKDRKKLIMCKVLEEHLKSDSPLTYEHIAINDASVFSSKMMLYIYNVLLQKYNIDDPAFMRVRVLSEPVPSNLDGYNHCTEEDIDELETKIRALLEIYAPGVDFSDISIFEDARAYLKLKDGEKFKYRNPIHIKGRGWLEEKVYIKKIANFSEKVDRPKVKRIKNF